MVPELRAPSSSSAASADSSIACSVNSEKGLIDDYSKTPYAEAKSMADPLPITVAGDSEDDEVIEFKQPLRKKQQVALLISGFFATFMVSGLTQSYGVFQSFHPHHLGHPDALLPDHDAKKRGLLALVGTLCSTSIALILGIFMTPILDNTTSTKWFFGERSGVTWLMAGGSILLGLGYFLSAFVRNLWQLILTQGLMAGVGGALLFYPVQTISPEYFKSHRALAFGIQASGSGLGGFTFSFLLHELLERLGIRKTFHVLAGSNLIVGLLLALITPPPRPVTTPRKFLPKSVRSQPLFYMLMATGFIFSMALGQPSIFGPDFGRSIALSARNAAIWLAVMNGVGAPSRIAFGYIGDRYGRQGTCLVTSCVGGIGALAFWLPAARLRSAACFWIFTILFGSGAAGFNQFISPILLDLYGPEVYFSVNAAVALARGLGSLIGSPIGGAILGNRKEAKEHPEMYTWLIVFTASSLLISCVISTVIWLMTRRKPVKSG
ncbi:MFS general substrate transporter [Microthyrium microscopicum]|uniref:MFS general substrate transporter n=1 Tax=Microthyrium microscopicum TaxID=703497 RepID=A0A6A6TXW8_9PEZI|nr:MFS general substrate transporter [Microthyrium microscopicum]